MQYSGSTQASWGYKPNCTFTVNKIAKDRFRGTFSATNIGSYSFSNKAIEGKVFYSENAYTFIFTVQFYENRYYSNIVATVYPYDGKCECRCAGSWHLLDFTMTGTKFNVYQDNKNIVSENNFNEEDMKLCMKLSTYIYSVKNNFSKTFVKQILSLENEEFFDVNNIKTSTLKVYNFKHFGVDDHNANNVSFSIMIRENDENIADVIVVIRGTYKDEWQGNTEITGKSYDESKLRHDNFQKASESIKPIINDYVEKYCESYENINLIITGHSRGAAVANLYAKEATDTMNGENNNIPQFSNVTAYTFATPNVAKYESSMENYNNIYNFCFAEDLVPTVPLTNPTNGWNYWKYGKTYIADLNNENITNSGFNNELYIASQSVSKIHDELWKWPTIESYYNKKLYENNSTENYTTLFDFAQDTTGTLFGSISKKLIGVGNIIENYKSYNDIFKVVGTILPYATSIANAHNFDTYLRVINKFGDDPFDELTYSDLTSGMNLVSLYSTNDAELSTEDSTDEYNSTQTEQLKTFANQGDNLSALGWDLDDVTSWDGIEFDADGNVTDIDLSYKSLTGSLDLSNITTLKTVNISGNGITAFNLTDCTNLEEIDCSFNNLTTLDISTCTNLKEITCCYNYLYVHEGGTLYNTLENLLLNDCYVNYEPQFVPDNATFNQDELDILKAFAQSNSSLDWLDDNGNISIEKLQNNVLFEYDGSDYRITAIDMSDLDVAGELNLNAFTNLEYLYLENTNITKLDLTNCTKLNTLNCDGSKISTFLLPSNAGDNDTTLYDVSCEYNYIDTSIFTSDMISNITFKAGATLQYENQKGDSSALQAALYFANQLDENDYSEETFNSFAELVEECNAYDYDNLYLTQENIDEITTNIIVSMYDLKPYFNIKISSQNGMFTINDEEAKNSFKKSLLYGTTVTLNATPNEGYSFVGWYDTVNNIYMSKNEQYTFKVSTNIKLKAVFASAQSATLSFVNYSNWVAGTFTKSTEEWLNTTTINDLLPEVPFRFGYNNGRWVYNEQEILSKLQNGEDVSITAEYDEDDTSLPTPPTATDKPALDLYYKYNEANTLGTFLMAAGFPEDIEIESVGIAFYYKKADTFDPTDNFTLLLNNKMLIGRFNTEQLEDIYIVNMNKMSSTYNWAARGFVTYYDANGDLATVYSNQINIIDKKEV